MTLTQDLQAHDYAVLQLPIAAAPRIDRTPGHFEGNSGHALVLGSFCSEHPPTAEFQCLSDSEFFSKLGKS